MANRDAPHGFKLLGTLSGGEFRIMELPVAAANTVIGIGDPVVMTVDGVIDRAAASATQICGIAQQAKAASSGGTCLVCVNPDLILEAQTDGSSGAGGADVNASTSAFLNANLVATDAVAGVSRFEIDQDSGATTATLPLKVIQLYPDIENAYGDYNRWIVIINNHAFKSVGVDGLNA